MIELIDTDAAAIATAFIKERRRSGSPAMGMVMTLVVVVDEDEAPTALDAARTATREHPARVLAVILGDRRGRGQVAAQVGIGDGWTGETAVIRLRGEVARFPESVVAPLLLPDSPVVLWWPHDGPSDPAADPLGALAQRRITDVAASRRGKAKALAEQCASFRRGNTDLAWTRLTPWRALLAAALDQQPSKVRRAEVAAERISPSADLLVAWLSDRLKVPVVRSNSSGPGVTRVALESAAGTIEVSRNDGRVACYRIPGQPDRQVALPRRALPDLLAEELRRLDDDVVYHAATKRLLALAAKQ